MLGSDVDQETQDWLSVDASHAGSDHTTVDPKELSAIRIQAWQRGRSTRRAYWRLVGGFSKRSKIELLALAQGSAEQHQRDLADTTLALLDVQNELVATRGQLDLQCMTVRALSSALGQAMVDKAANVKLQSGRPYEPQHEEETASLDVGVPCVQVPTLNEPPTPQLHRKLSGFDAAVRSTKAFVARANWRSLGHGLKRLRLESALEEKTAAAKALPLEAELSLLRSNLTCSRSASLAVGATVTLGKPGGGLLHVLCTGQAGIFTPCVTPWSLFKVVDGGGGNVALYNAMTRQFLRLAGSRVDGRGGVCTEPALPPAWLAANERFAALPVESGTVALYCPHEDKFVSTSMDEVAAKTADSLGSWPVSGLPWPADSGETLLGTCKNNLDRFCVLKVRTCLLNVTVVAV